MQQSVIETSPLLCSFYCFFPLELKAKNSSRSFVFKWRLQEKARKNEEEEVKVRRNGENEEERSEKTRN